MLQEAERLTLTHRNGDRGLLAGGVMKCRRRGVMLLRDSIDWSLINRSNAAEGAMDTASRFRETLNSRYR